MLREAGLILAAGDMVKVGGWCCHEEPRCRLCIRAGGLKCLPKS